MICNNCGASERVMIEEQKARSGSAVFQYCPRCGQALENPVRTTVGEATGNEKKVEKLLD